MQPTSRPITLAEFDALVKALVRALKDQRLPIWYRTNTESRIRNLLVSPTIFVQERNDGTSGVSLTLDQFRFQGEFVIYPASRNQKLTVEAVAYSLKS